MNHWRIILVVVGVLLGGISRAGDLRLPALFADGMVVQAGVNIPVWGEATPGAIVTVTGLGAEAKAIADSAGAWRTTLPAALPSATPRELVVEAGGERRRIANLLVGEVWLCLGEGNLFVTAGDRLHRTVDRDHSLQARAPTVRLFTVEGVPSLSTRAAFRGRWVAVAPETTPQASALATLFAMELARRAEGIPVGVVVAATESSRLESWIAAESLRTGASKDWAARAASVVQEMKGLPELEAKYAERWRRWWEGAEAKENGFLGGWMETSVDDALWPESRLPKGFSGDGRSMGLQSWNGSVWCRRTLAVPLDWAGRDLTMSLGGLSPQDRIWVNGTELLEKSELPTKGIRVQIPGDLLAKPALSVAIRLFKFTPESWQSCKPESWEVRCPSRNSKPEYLAGAWKWRTGIKLAQQPPPPETPWQFHPAATLPGSLFNGLLQPLAPYPLRGIVLCQGEGNVDDPTDYKELLAAAVAGWRQAWGEPLPLLCIQLPPSAYPQAVGKAPLIREAQELFLAETRRIGLASTMDLGNAASPISERRDEMARRLAAIAAVRIYGKTLDIKPPAFKEVSKEGNAIRVTFKNADGLDAAGDAPQGFCISGADGKFLVANARIEGATVIVSHPDIADPVAVRYAFSNNPKGNLFNRNGLPAQPFRTDTWKNYEVTMPVEE